MKIGILRETKTPPDRRVPFTPEQCRELLNSHQGLELVVQPSDNRCFSNEEYQAAGVPMQEELSDCDVLMGVKEVKIEGLIPGKIYLFFSHTAKEQPYNRGLLQAIVEKKITLLDYEYLTRADNTRVVAFGRWAGIVGAYNGLRAFGLRSSMFELRPASELQGLQEMKQVIGQISLGKTRIVLTGGGRVAMGAMEILQAVPVTEVSPVEYLSGSFEKAVCCRLDPWHYTRHIHELDFNFDHFMKHPEEYENAFVPFAQVSDLFMACHFWDPNAPPLLSRDDLSAPEMSLSTIADISCDIDGPIASTIRPSTIADPIYGYDPASGKETKNAFENSAITVMAVDNLPGELPRDASADFGRALMEHVIPSIVEEDSERIIERSRITSETGLTERYSYLEDYLKGK